MPCCRLTALARAALACSLHPRPPPVPCSAPSDIPLHTALRAAPAVRQGSCAWRWASLRLRARFGLRLRARLRGRSCGRERVTGRACAARSAC
eukprot:6173159-Pleurochrysis_carterae.AAC.1